MIGTKLGSYEIIEEVGKGGMATVYRAYQPSVDRFVAIKVIRRSIAEDPEAMARFQREARVVARLEHPHVLPIHDFAHDPPYLVMRYLEGGTLKDALRRKRLPLDEVGLMLRQVAAALDYAHRQGVVHRDIKPSNVLLDGEGNAFVGDFGIARIVAQEGAGAGPGLTQSGSLMGTPGYMAPEQAMGRGADHRADLYSLGVLVFEMLSGQLPYQGETPMEAVFKHVSEPVPSACALNDSLPAAVDEVLRRAMAKDPAARYGTASELAEAIVVALGGTVAHTPRGLQEAAAESVRMVREARKARRDEIEATLAKYGAGRDVGADTDSQHTPTERNRLVTVLYANLSEYAEYLEAEDADIVRDTLEGVWGQLEGVIADRGGWVQDRGYDTSLALWGVEATREDDPERAVRAALEMRAALGGLLGQDDGSEPLPMQVGITTGLALLTPGDEEGSGTSASGPPISLVHRLERAAPQGSITISHDTYRHVRGVFDVEPGDPLRVRGRKRPLETYVIRSVKPRALRLNTRGIEGVETRMVGRRLELQSLQEAFYAAAEDGETQVVTVVSQPGLGKSRLLYEFRNWLELEGTDAWLARGRAVPEMAGRPYALLRDLFSYRFAIQDSDSPEAVRAKLEGGIAPVVDAAAAGKGIEMAHFIGHLLGFDLGAADSPHLADALGNVQALHRQALHYLGQLLQHVTRRSPAVIELDGIHWADESSLDAIDHLVRRNTELPLLVVCLARPELYERRPAWGSGQRFHTRLDLRPLSRRESRRLVAEILQQADKVPDALRDLVVERAEGNPFYVEELIKMLIEERVIIKEEPVWRVEPERLSGVRVPSTLTGLIQGRLDGLFPAERAVLQRAAVVGRVFWDDAVRALGAADALAVDVGAALVDLAEREFVYVREASAFAGAGEFIFASSVLRDVVLEGILGRQRRGYHALVAEWLIERGGERVDEYAGVIADHLEQAEETERAVAYLQRAGERAAAQYADAEAIDYYGRALHLTPKEDQSARYELLKHREYRYHVLGKREAQRQDLTAMEELAEALDDGSEQAWDRRVWQALRWSSFAWITDDYPATIVGAQAVLDLLGPDRLVSRATAGATTLFRLGLAHWRQGDYDAARLHIERALSVSDAAGYDFGRANSLGALGLVCTSQGNYEEASACFERSLSIYRGIGARRNEGWMLNDLGAVSLARGDYGTAKTYLGESLRISREVGDRPAEGWALRNLGQLSHHLGDHVGAREDYDQALRIFSEIDDRSYKSETLSNLGLLFHHLADNESAQQHSQRALHIAQDIGFRSGQGDALTSLGHALVGLGQLTEAAEAYGQALALRRELGQLYLVPEPLAGLARVAQAQGGPAGALTHVSEILDYLDDHPALEGAMEPLRIYMTCYRVLQANGDPRAGEILDAAYRLLQERAAKIDEEDLRRSFLENVAAHREIIEERERNS